MFNRILIAASVAAAGATVTMATPAVAATLIVDDDGGQCPLPDHATVQAAVAAASSGDTIVVCDGVYDGPITVDKNLTMMSQNGAATTTLTATTPGGSLGTIVVTNNTTAVRIGAAGQGFDITGVDNGSAGIENSAIYFQGNHSNATVEGNVVRANGDSALLTEFAATISGFVITGNEFAGQTFLGPEPAGSGFGQQFTLANVPRQLVMMGGGSGGGNTSNTSFTNNTITGTAGGTNAGGEQGNTLVTIDSVGATIAGNTFAGVTSRLASSLRTRGPSTTISGNTFVTTGIEFPSRGASHVFLQNTGQTTGSVVQANTFDRGIAIDGPSGTVHFDFQDVVEAAPAGSDVYVAGVGHETRSQTVIDADVEIIGMGAGTTVVRPGFDTGSSGDSRGWFRVESGVDVAVSAITFDGNGRLVHQAFRHLGSGSFDDVAFTNIHFNSSGPTYAGTAIAAFGGDDVDVTDSVFTGIGRIGVLYFGAGSTGTFSGNTYTGKGDGDFLDYALDISAGAVVEVADNTITGNRGVASTGGSTSAAVLVSTFFGSGTSATITGNTIADNTTGIASGFDGNDASTIVVTGNTISDNGIGVSVIQAVPASSVSGNAIVGNGAGIENADAEGDDLAAACNWYGDISGPNGEGPGVGDSVSTDVVFSPWLTDASLATTCGDVPAAPTDVAAVAGDTVATLTWSTSADTGGAEITGYVIEHSTDGGATWTVSTTAAPPDPSGTTVTGLANDTTHRFRVATSNAIGDSEFAESNDVFFDSIGPVATIDRADGQAASVTSTPIAFEITFDEEPVGFDAGDLDVSGTAGATGATLAGGPLVWTATVQSVPDPGTVVLDVAAGVAADAAGNDNGVSTIVANTVTISDETGPELALPADAITTNTDDGEPFATVTFEVTAVDPSSSESFGDSPTVTCSPSSGSQFSIGTTTVACSAADDADNTSTGTFDVVVVDDENPTLTPIADITVQAPTGQSSAVVTYDAPVATDNSGAATVICSVPTGSRVGVGSTTNTCTATDPSGNTVSVSATVTVTATPTTELPATGSDGLGDSMRTASLVLLAGVALYLLGRRRIAR